MEKITNSDYIHPRMLAAQAFDEILDGIQKSNLNYQMQISPFSAFISLKKSLTKDENGSLILPPVQPAIGADVVKLVTRIHDLESNLAVQKSNYDEVVNELEIAREKVRGLELTKNKVATSLEIENKTLKQETKALASKLENKALENKQLRGEIDVLSRDKNAIQVALKSAKQDLKSQNIITENKMMAYEKKIEELNIYKSKKINEERQERLKKKKELKKEAKRQRLKSGSIEVVEVIDLKVSGTNSGVKCEHEKVVEEKERDLQTVTEEKGDLNMNKQSGVGIEPTQNDPEPVKTNANDFENIELEEKEEGFIGPRLPRLMTKGEVDVLFKGLFPNSDRSNK